MKFIKFKNQLPGLFTIFIASFFLFSCEKDDPALPLPFLENDEITISNVSGIPSGITFNKIKIEIQGYDWQVIDIIEADYTDGKAVLLLPSTYPADKLMKVARDNRFDYTGFWHAHSDNPNAKVASLGDITAYDNDKKVGTFILTDWSGSGSKERTANIYYHYTNEPYTLTNPQSDTNKSYSFQASFNAGWNAHANIQTLDSEIGKSKIQCIAPVPTERKYAWYFQPILY